MGIEELLAAIEAKKGQIKDLVKKNDLDGATTAKNELKELQAKLDLIIDLDDDETSNMQNKINNGKATPAEPKNSTKEFADAARNGFPVNSMSSGSNADGGYTVPEDIQTKIEKYRESKASLRDLVRVKSVKTDKGKQTFKKRAQQTGFTKVGEGGKIPGKNTPQFEQKSWEIEKYAGYFPVTNELLEDSDVNIEAELIEWIGDESRVTGNKIILAAINEKDVTALSGLDDLKKAVNVTLGAAFKATSKVVTNDDGLQWLDTLKDGNENYILRHNPADPMDMYICAGATTIPIKVYPNADLPSDVATVGKRKIPMIIGDLHEYLEFKDRKHLTIKTSDVAVVGSLNAYEEDLTLWRAIERETAMIRDEASIVNGQITIDDVTVMGE